jgi:hypothetical protein
LVSSAHTRRLRARGFRFSAVLLGMLLGGFSGVMRGVMKMALGGVRVVSGGLVIAVLVVLGRFAVMASCVFMVLRCLGVVLGCLLGHGSSSS